MRLSGSLAYLIANGTYQLKFQAEISKFDIIPLPHEGARKAYLINNILEREYK